MTRDGVIEKVRAIMNEIGAEENLSLLSEDTVRLSEYISSVIPDAINLVVQVAPIRHLNVSSQTGVTSVINGISTVLLPSDLIRFISLKLDSWKRAVYMVYPSGSDTHKAQHNPITRAGVNKPVCSFSYSGGGNVLECSPSGNLEYFYYVKNVSSGANLQDAVKESMDIPICYMCAYLVYNIFEMAETAERMKNIAIELISKD